MRRPFLQVSVVSKKWADVREGFEDHVEPAELFESVYLGCSMSDDDVTAMVDHVRQHLPKANVLRARKSEKSFNLEFDEVYAGVQE